MSEQATTQKYKPKTIAIDELYLDTVFGQSVDFDFSKGIGDAWDVLTPEKPDFENDEDREEWEREYESEYAPMMNYYYPLPSDFERDMENRFGSLSSAVLQLEHVSLCIVRFSANGHYALALTGGGMDMQWDICEAFIQLGYAPPLNFCELPEFAGYILSERNRRIIQACKRSAEHAQSVAKKTEKHLKQIRQTLNANSKTQRKR